MPNGRFWICCCCSVPKLCLTLCDPTNSGKAGFSVHHYLSELPQTHIHLVSDVIQTSHPLSSPSPPAFNLSQHQGLFKWVISLHQVAKVLELHHQSFQWIFRLISFKLTGLILLSKGLSRVFSSTIDPIHQFFGAQSSLWSNSHIHTLLLKNHSFD